MTVWSCLLPYRRPALLGAGCLLLTNGLGLAIPWVLEEAIDRFLAEPSTAARVAVWSALALVALGLSAAVVRILSRVLIFNVGRNVEYDVRRRVFDHLLALPPTYFLHHPTGDILSRLTNDLQAVRALCGFGLLNVVNTAFIYVLTVGRMVAIDAHLTLLALLPIPALVIFGRLTGRTMFKRSRELADELGHLSANIQEDLAGVAVVKGYALEAARRGHFAQQNDRYASTSMRLVVARGLMGPLLGMTAAVGTLIVLWAGGRDVTRGQLTLGEFAAFHMYLVQLAWPTMAIGWILAQ
jgi:ATP-binding cassette subfamily B protein